MYWLIEANPISISISAGFFLALRNAIFAAGIITVIRSSPLSNTCRTLYPLKRGCLGYSFFSQLKIGSLFNRIFIGTAHPVPIMRGCNVAIVFYLIILF